MPQLEKGGKFVFGWSVIRPDGGVRLPDEVIREYGLTPGENVILMSGSATTGGFRVTRQALLESSVIYAEMLRQLPGLATYALEEGRAVRFKGGRCCWARLGADGALALPPHTLEAFDVRPGDALLSIRGSYLAVVMGVKGPLIALARQHPEIQVWA